MMVSDSTALVIQGKLPEPQDVNLRHLHHDVAENIRRFIAAIRSIR